MTVARVYMYVRGVWTRKDDVLVAVRININKLLFIFKCIPFNSHVLIFKINYYRGQWKRVIFKNNIFFFIGIINREKCYS